MAVVTLVATWGGETSNSYVTLTDANSIAATTMASSLWFSYDDEKRSQALLRACRDIDSRPWLGEPLFLRQALAFPRSLSLSFRFSLTDVSSFSIDLERQKKYVPEAQVYQAIYRLAQIGQPDVLNAQQRGTLSISVSGGTVTHSIASTGTGHVLSYEAAALLREWKRGPRLLRG
ncbi:MAG: hypothetical protein Q9M19_04895 [Mariprofundaceae bacterium]|nr:hypothetical protein [Mariprofundaceae bacterium]